MIRTASTLAIFVFLLTGSQAWRASADPSTDVAQGAIIYAQNCGRCHNPRSPRDLNDQQWSIAITHMRIIAGLPGEQARQVLAFMQANNNPPLPAEAPQAKAAAPPAAPAGQPSGSALIDQYGCRACHVIGGSGGNAGPNLDTVFKRHDEALIRTQIEHPQTHNATSIMPVFGLTDAQADAIIETLRGSQKR